MPRQETYPGLTREDAEDRAATYDEGVDVQVIAEPGGSCTLTVTYPDDWKPAGLDGGPATAPATRAAENAAQIIATCNAEWPVFSGDCSGFVRQAQSSSG